MNELISVLNQDGNLVVSSREGRHLDYIGLYELASKKSYEVSKYGVSKLLSLVDLAKAITPEDKNLPFIEQSVRELILRNYMSSIPREKDIQSIVKENITKVFNECEVISRINDHRHQPDLWLVVQGEEVPVEIKLKKFNRKALEQLERYITFYKCNKGVAIAEKLTTKLPQNIKFISVMEFLSREEENH